MLGQVRSTRNGPPGCRGRGERQSLRVRTTKRLWRLSCPARPLSFPLSIPKVIFLPPEAPRTQAPWSLLPLGPRNDFGCTSSLLQVPDVALGPLRHPQRGVRTSPKSPLPPLKQHSASDGHLAAPYSEWTIRIVTRPSDSLAPHSITQGGGPKGQGRWWQSRRK